MEKLNSFDKILPLRGIGKVYPVDKTLRIIDANQNRAKEGLRVCEEVVRFILNDTKLTGEFRTSRHKISKIISSLPVDRKELLKHRDTEKDIGKDISERTNRAGYQDIFSANIQRVKESLRVLEEFSSLVSKDARQRFKRLRFKVYNLEKKTIEKFSTLCNNR